MYKSGSCRCTNDLCFPQSWICNPISEILWLETNGYSLGPFLGIHILLPSFSSWKDLAYKLGIPAGAASCLAIAPAPGTPKLPGFLGKRLLGCSRGSTWLLHCSGLAGRSSWSLHGFAFASAFPFAFSFALLVPTGIYLQLVHSLLLIFFQIWNHRLIIVSWFCRSLILEDWKCLLWDCRWCFWCCSWSCAWQWCKTWWQDLATATDSGSCGSRCRAWGCCIVTQQFLHLLSPLGHGLDQSGRVRRCCPGCLHVRLWLCHTCLLWTTWSSIGFVPEQVGSGSGRNMVIHQIHQALGFWLFPLVASFHGFFTQLLWLHWVNGQNLCTSWSWLFETPETLGQMADHSIDLRVGRHGFTSFEDIVNQQGNTDLPGALIQSNLVW